VQLLSAVDYHDYVDDYVDIKIGVVVMITCLGTTKKKMAIASWVI